jgi:hypothetical protein
MKQKAKNHEPSCSDQQKGERRRVETALRHVRRADIADV